MSKTKVLVIDANNNSLIPTNSANARRLLKNKEAIIFNKEPFTIKLTKEIIMSKKTLTPREIRELFMSNDDIYVQNVSVPIAILALNFKNRNGDRLPFKGIPANRDPICLSDYFTNDIIREGSNISGFLNPSQTTGEARIAVITKEFHDNYYKVKSVEREEIFNVETSPEELMKEANREVANVGKLKEDKSLVPVIKESPKPQTVKEVLKKDPIIPKTRGICEQLDPANVEKAEITKIIASLKDQELDEDNLRYVLRKSVV